MWLNNEVEFTDVFGKKHKGFPCKRTSSLVKTNDGFYMEIEIVRPMNGRHFKLTGWGKVTEVKKAINFLINSKFNKDELN